MFSETQFTQQSKCESVLRCSVTDQVKHRRRAEERSRRVAQSQASCAGQKPICHAMAAFTHHLLTRGGSLRPGSRPQSDYRRERTMNVSRLIGLGDATKGPDVSLSSTHGQAADSFVSLAGGYGSLNKSVKIRCRSGSKALGFSGSFSEISRIAVPFRDPLNVDHNRTTDS
jgi:hypothetical protein